ncbi:MAG TPA: FGGY-family carbohydrate kinase [Acetobacteraceae bacterium]|nr:FGGY-family carbohydrate kinase [Acetobacteraceae bacterium]
MAERAIILAVDAGTSVIKAVAFDQAGRLLGSRARRNVYQESAGGAAEQDLARTWEDTASVLAELVAATSAREIAALAITGQGDGTWLIDAAGRPAAPAMLWLDARAASIVEALHANGAAQAAFAETGTGLAACQQSVQLLWLQQRQPEVLARAATAFHCKDWLYFNLTGTRVTDAAEASFTFGNWRTRTYSNATLAALGLQDLRAKLPPVVEGTRVAHGLCPGAAARLGLPAGLPVVLAYLDVICTALGAGIYTGGPESGVSIIGSTGMHMKLARTPAAVLPSPAMTGYCTPFPVPGTTVQMQSNMAATLNIDWVVGLAADAVALAGATPDRAALLAALDTAAAAATPAAALFHPFISAAGERGPFTDAAARAALMGLERGLGLGGLMRTVCEALAFAARDCFESIGGVPPVIHVAGGGARSAAQRAILATVLNRPVRTVAQPEAGAAGAAMIAALNLGLYPDMASCAAIWVEPLLGPPEQPDAALAGLYDRFFSIYRESCAAMPPLWHRMHAFQEARHAA